MLILAQPRVEAGHCRLLLSRRERFVGIIQQLAAPLLPVLQALRFAAGFAPLPEFVLAFHPFKLLVRFDRRRTLFQNSNKEQVLLQIRANRIELRRHAPTLIPAVNPGMQGNRMSFRAALVGEGRLDPGPIDLGQDSCKTFLLRVTEPSSTIVGWTDFVHERELGPKRVSSQSSVFVELRPELVNRLAAADSATAESRGDHAGADQVGIRLLRRYGQLSVAQHRERRCEVTEHAMHVIRILCLPASSPDEIRHLVPARQQPNPTRPRWI